MNFKRMFGITITVLAMTLMVACSGKSTTAGSKDFNFEYKGETVTVDSEAKKLLEAAGTPDDTKKTASCAYDGYDRTYVYKGVTITTYSKTKDGEEYINGITLTDPSVATKEDIKIGSSDKDVFKAYGDEKGKFGVYTYTKGKSKLVIELDDSNKVSSVQYMAK